MPWAVGAGQTDPALAEALDVAGAAAAQAGLIEDMDGIARRLNEVYQP